MITLYHFEYSVRQKLAELEAEEASDAAEEPSTDEDDDGALLDDDLDRQVRSIVHGREPFCSVW